LSLAGIAIFMFFWMVTRYEPATAPEDADVVVYATASCKCYRPWVRALKRDGLKVGVVQTRSIIRTQADLGVPREFSACHTAAAGGYWFEGHVPAESIARLLADTPSNISGLANLRAEQQTGERLLWEVVTYDAEGDPISSIPQVEEFSERGEGVIHEQ
tara:strand:- start:175 stop:651 length:477 start_codon:yes stop_codon:yes gene_type:complete